MSTLPQKFYPVVDNAQWVDRLGAAGARFIQLRVKDMPEPELRAQVRLARDYAARHDVCLVLNDFWRIALDEGLAYIHLGQEDLDTADMTAIRNGRLQVGLSTHCQEELDRALTFEPDYVALGPIWETRLKKMAFGPQGVERLGEWKRQIGAMPLVAIGGITLERAPLCLQAGADCVSAVSAFTQQADPEGQVKAWIAATGR